MDAPRIAGPGSYAEDPAPLPPGRRSRLRRLGQLARLAVDAVGSALARRGLGRAPAPINVTFLSGSQRFRVAVSLALAIEPDDYFTLYNVACGYAHLGEIDSALELLERSMPRANEERKAWLRHDSDLDPLRQHPRFLALLRRLETEP